MFGIGRPNIARACKANCERSCVIIVTIPVSCGRGETSLKMTSSPLTNNSIPNIAFHGAGASRAVVVEGDSNQLSLGNLDKVLEQPDTQMRFFGKPEVHGHRRMAVLLARGLDVADARRKTGVMMEQLEIKL